MAKQMHPPGTVGDFYWAYCDILRGAYGISESMYDQRVMAFMALKLLVDNAKVGFNFDYTANFGQVKYTGSPKEVFTQIVNDLPAFDKSSYLAQPVKLHRKTTSDELESVLTRFNSPQVFDLSAYVEELSEPHLLLVLDAYREKANFAGYPPEEYKDLYERTVWRMANSGKKSISGQLTGQHFTQRAIIKMMCATAWPRIAKLKSGKRGQPALAIYDPTCGVGSMLMESYFYFKQKQPNLDIKVYGQELSPQVWALAKIFLEVADIPNEIALGNTLTAPAFSSGVNGDSSFDFIIANPPFGVDWKHDYAAIHEDMLKDEGSSYLVVKDAADKPLTPRKSDGQLLFIQHILKLLKTERTARNKSGFAAVVTSGSLISVGTDASAEAQIRQAIFNSGLLYAVVEQPQGMFTNTDVATHVWMFQSGDNGERCRFKLLKADHPAAPMFSTHPAARDKMRSTYSDENIEAIAAEVNNRVDNTPVSIGVSTKNRRRVSFATELPIASSERGKSLSILDAELKEMVRQLAVMAGVLV